MQDEFMTPEQWTRSDRLERIKRAVATSTAIETGEPSEALYERLSKPERRFNVDLCTTVRCRSCHGTGSDGWQACQSCGGSGQVEGVFEPYD